MIIISVGLLIILSLSSIYFIVNVFQQANKLEHGTAHLFGKTDTIPFTYSSSGHILIDVKLDNSDRTYPFILDCGASNFIFKDRFSKGHFENNGFGIGKGANGNFFTTKIKSIDTLIIGTTKFCDLNAQEIEFTYDCSQEIYGLIGTGVMHHFEWHIDFKKKLIVISNQVDDFKIEESAIKIPLKVNRLSNHLSTSISFGKNKKSHKILIDLGNSGTLLMKEDLLIKDSLNAKSINIAGNISGGLGKTDENKQTESIYLVDTMLFNNSDLKILSIPIKTGPKALNLLGLGFFEQYITTLSWKTKTLFLEPYSADQNFIWETFGIIMEYDDDLEKVIISNIIENSVAYYEEIPINTELVSVNGILLKNEKSLCDYISVKQGKYMDLVLLIKGVEQQYRLEKKPVFE